MRSFFLLFTAFLGIVSTNVNASCVPERFDDLSTKKLQIPSLGGSSLDITYESLARVVILDTFDEAQPLNEELVKLPDNWFKTQIILRQSHHFGLENAWHGRRNGQELPLDKLQLISPAEEIGCSAYIDQTKRYYELRAQQETLVEKKLQASFLVCLATHQEWTKALNDLQDDSQKQQEKIQELRTIYREKNYRSQSFRVMLDPDYQKLSKEIAEVEQELQKIRSKLEKNLNVQATDPTPSQKSLEDFVATVGSQYQERTQRLEAPSGTYHLTTAYWKNGIKPSPKGLDLGGMERASEGVPPLSSLTSSLTSGIVSVPLTTHPTVSSSSLASSDATASVPAVLSAGLSGGASGSSTTSSAEGGTPAPGPSVSSTVDPVVASATAAASGAPIVLPLPSPSSEAGGSSDGSLLLSGTATSDGNGPKNITLLTSGAGIAHVVSSVFSMSPAPATGASPPLLASSLMPTGGQSTPMALSSSGKTFGAFDQGSPGTNLSSGGGNSSLSLSHTSKVIPAKKTLGRDFDLEGGWKNGKTYGVTNAADLIYGISPYDRQVYVLAILEKPRYASNNQPSRPALWTTPGGKKEFPWAQKPGKKVHDNILHAAAEEGYEETAAHPFFETEKMRDRLAKLTEDDYYVSNGTAIFAVNIGEIPTTLINKDGKCGVKEGKKNRLKDKDSCYDEIKKWKWIRGKVFLNGIKNSDWTMGGETKEGFVTYAKNGLRAFYHNKNLKELILQDQKKSAATPSHQISGTGGAPNKMMPQVFNLDPRLVNQPLNLQGKPLLPYPQQGFSPLFMKPMGQPLIPVNNNMNSMNFNNTNMNMNRNFNNLNMNTNMNMNYNNKMNFSNNQMNYYQGAGSPSFLGNQMSNMNYNNKMNFSNNQMNYYQGVGSPSFLGNPMPNMNNNMNYNNMNYMNFNNTNLNMNNNINMINFNNNNNNNLTGNFYRPY